MDDLADLLRHAASTAAGFRAGLSERAVRPDADLAALRGAFGGPLPREGAAPRAVVDELIRAAEPGLTASAGPRFFGFVIGGALPAATAADMLAAGWDQCAFNAVLSPAAAAAEECAGRWLKDLLCIPAAASIGFVTGGQEANTVGLAAARHYVLVEAGWDVERDGLIGAPAVRVVVGEERHATVDRSLRLLGLGTAQVEPVPTDANGAIRVDDLDRVLAHRGGPLIVSLQAGNVNTGACDDLRTACDVVHRHGGWAHVDGAFGLWAAANPATAHLVDGIELADSWSCDGHKWLNVPYDSGFSFCARPDVHVAAVSHAAPYLTGSGGATAVMGDSVLSASRRARGFAVWVALRQLGADGVAALVERCCGLARRFADRLTEGGLEIVNEVVLNQVLVGFEPAVDDAHVDRVVEAVQREGTCWLGATTWRGRRLMRISVSNHATTDTDIDRSAEAIVRVAARA
ncbi:MAG: aminotransferase class V-fold PLP-dependent enzyme [Actinophytocola sp.]|nr:aminotransferase class V-fold PLP-dependent enzyme [Actinophytocola sp.]